MPNREKSKPSGRGTHHLKKTIVATIVMLLFFGIAIESVFASSATLQETVNNLLGSPYKYGGTTPKGFDCSGFTQYVFAQWGIELPHNSKAQSKEGTAVKREELRPGDLVFFNTSGQGISHVGIYMGNGKFAHAAYGDGVTITDMDSTYYKKRYVTAVRILTDEQYEQWAKPN